MFIMRLKEAEPLLTYSDRIIAKYFLEKSNLDEMVTSGSIAKQVKVGQATVIRFSKKLGYFSYKEMMVDLSKAMSLDFSDNEIDSQESTLMTIERIKNSYSMSIEEITSLNSCQDIDNVVNAIKEAKTVFCLGTQSSQTIVDILHVRLAEIGLFALRSDSIYDAISIVRNLTPQDLLFVISTSGESPDSVKIARIAADKKVPIISITGMQNNTIRDLSTYSLNCAKYNMYAHSVTWVNRCSQLFLLDCIFINLWKRNQANYYNKVKEVSTYYYENDIKKPLISERFRIG